MTSVHFFLNGKPISIENPSPDLLLIDFLRSPDIGLAGPKKPCGQGGCGGCTVILSEWNDREKKPIHLAINSCLRPVCALGGLSITTIEGTGAARKPDPEFLVHRPSASRSGAPIGFNGSTVLDTAKTASVKKRGAVQKDIHLYRKNLSGLAVTKVVEEIHDHPSEHTHAGMNPVAHRLAINNGSQCGYCSVGFVMNMTEFISNNPKATKKQIEQALDGNLCRCTGYRSILTGMKTFASDWSEQDEKNRMPCIEDHVGKAQLPADILIHFPKAAQQTAYGISANRWSAPKSLMELAQIMDKNKNTRLVFSNTSYGVYKNEYLETTHYADIRFIPELNTANRREGNHLYVSAGISYSNFIKLLSKSLEELQPNDDKTSTMGTSALSALDYMAERTAGRIVRNEASLGGNTLLVLKHIHIGSGDPFPSDLFTTLFALNASITYFLLGIDHKFSEHAMTCEAITLAAMEDPTFVNRIVITSYSIPLGDKNEIVFAQKVALREVNAHSIVNSTTFFKFDGSSSRINSARLVFGGITSHPWRAIKTENQIIGKELTLAQAGHIAQMLAKEVSDELIQPKRKKRMEEVPNEGFTLEYLTQLTVSFFYKSVVHALTARGDDVPNDLISTGEQKWGNWPVSDGKQSYVSQAYKAPVAQPYIKVTAMYQTSGQTHYTHEIPVPPLTLNGAFVQSQRALMNYSFVNPEDKKQITIAGLRKFLKIRFHQFTDIITHENIKNGGVNLQGMGLDQPLFAEKLVSYVGQSIALVLAEKEQDAIKIARYVSTECIKYSDPGSPWVGMWSKPIIDLLDAIKMGSIFPDAPVAAHFVTHIWKITRPGSQFDWVTKNESIQPKSLRREEEIVIRNTHVDNVPCTVVVSSQLCGGQAHFYMEPQACIATPLDEGRMKVQPSVQSPGGMLDTVAMALGMQHHQIEIKVPPVGGGFGGKTEQTRFIAGPTAVAAKATKRPVRLVVPRDEDTAMIGKRHAYYGEYQIAVDDGTVSKNNKGIIHGFQLKMWGDGGAFYDCSFIVSNCIQLRTDNAYRISNFESQIDVCRTNTAPNTAMRAFGDVQGKNIVENAIDDAAISINMKPEDLREKNFYDRGDVTPFGQALSYCYMKQVWAYAKQVSDFDNKCIAVEKFNQENKWRKRGISMIPVKYGSGYNLLLLEQSSAIVVVNPKDGTVIIHQGGVEIGQGLVTQAQQVAAYVLGIPMEMIFISDVNTSIIPNPTSTGGSTGTPYSCEAVKQTCEILRSRLMDFGYQLLKENGEDFCKTNKIDFWNYGAGEGKGWATMVGEVGKQTMIWQNLTNLASANRINLLASFNANIKGGEVQVPAMTFKTEADQPNIPGIDRVHNANLGGGVDSFVGFTYSAACSVTEVDILTGEVKIISSDIIYDMGWSMNPAIDIGQVEGAFVQGIGYLLTEKLVSETDGTHTGRLNTTNTWRYKIPAVTTIPLEMNTYLFPRNDESVKNIPPDTTEIFSAKEVGEPPLVLANSVFFAIKAAIRASRLERNLSPLFRLDAPATVQEVRRAAEVSEKDFAIH